MSPFLLARGQDECPDIDMSGVEDLIKDSYGGGDNPNPPTIGVTEFNVVCRAAGPTQGMYQYLSLVATYNCSGSDCENSTVTAQFDTGCSSGVWEEQVLSFSDDEVRTVPADGDSGTAVKTGCSLCLSPTRATDIDQTSDMETHCVGKLLSLCTLIMYLTFVFLCTACTCTPSTGLGQCYTGPSPDFTQICCNFYQNGMCVENCTDGRMATAEFNCGELDVLT